MDRLTKQCRNCHVEKPLEDFVKDKYTKDGHKRLCHVCNRIKVKESKIRNPESTLAGQHRWRNENRQYWLDFCRYHNGTLKELTRKTRTENRTREEARSFLKTWKAEYDVVNHDKNTAYRKANQPQIARNRRKRVKERESSDKGFRIMNRLRSRIHEALRYRARKHKGTAALLGCSITFFINWLEKNFEQGMTWDNYGSGSDKWHIDHNLPCASFDLTDPEQQKICFHWSNMFPMWQRHNLAKLDNLLVIDYEI